VRYTVALGLALLVVVEDLVGSEVVMEVLRIFISSSNTKEEGGIEAVLCNTNNIHHIHIQVVGVAEVVVVGIITGDLLQGSNTISRKE
jgi:hypothetical protein